MTPPCVAHFRSSYLGLSETFIYEILTRLRRFRAIVLARHILNRDAFPFEPIYRIDVAPFPYSLLGRLGLPEFALERYLMRLFRSERVRLLHAHFGPDGVAMLGIRKKTSLPLVTTFYGYDVSRHSLIQAMADAYNRLFQEGDLFLVEGDCMKTRLIGLGCPPQKIRVQHIGVNLERLEYQERHIQSGSDAFNMLFCGRFVEKKGLIYALQALNEARKEVHVLKLRIIGDGEEKDSIQKFIAENGLDNCVTLLGYQPHEVFFREMQRAHLLIQPSVTAADGDTEGGAPTVLLEAQACGLPVLSTHHADIPEIVKDGESGFLTPERDSHALAEKIVYLAKHPEKWAEMGQRGRMHVERHHHSVVQAGKLEDIYAELTDSR